MWVRIFEFTWTRVQVPFGSAVSVARTASRGYARGAPTESRAGNGPLLVVVDATVGLDETSDAPLVELVQRIDPRPRRQRDRVLHPGIRRENDVPVEPLHDGRELRDEIGALASVLHEHAAVLQVVNLELADDRPRMHAPRRDIRKAPPRGRRIRI